jgi:hypothetical protein
MSEETKEEEKKERPVVFQVLDLLGTAEMPINEAIGALEIAKMYLQVPMLEQLLKMRQGKEEKVVDFKAE